MKKIFYSFIAASLLASCTQPKTPEAQESSREVVNDKLSPCNITLQGVQFTHALNGADKQVVDSAGVAVFRALPSADYFCDPNGKLSQNDAAVLLKEIDNTKPFTFSAKLKAGFTPEGLYNAACLFVYANDTHFQKFCFEQDERGNHRVVTVRTKEYSDDNNHQVYNDIEHIYFKISSDAQTIASYYSLDGKEWQMVRLYKNDYPERLYIGLCSQAPQSDECVSTFEEIIFSTDNVGDFRMGE